MLGELSPRTRKALVRSQELEWQLLACEIHDGLSQTAASITQRQELLAGPDLWGTPEGHHLLSELVLHSQTLLRTIVALMVRLRHPCLEGVRLSDAIRRCIEQECSGIRVRLSMEPAVDSIDGAAALCLYRVVQESLVNVRKHARASRVSVQLRLRAGRLQGRIRDDGVGLVARSSQGFGLKAMSYRLRMLRGRFRSQALAAGGTEIRFQLPWKCSV